MEVSAQIRLQSLAYIYAPISLIPKEGRRVIYGDSQDSNFWGAFDLSHVNAIFLLIPDKSRKLLAAQLIRESGYRKYIHALVRNDEDISDLLEAGVNQASQPISLAAREIAMSVVNSQTLDKAFESS